VIAILLFHEVEIGVIEQLLARKCAIVKWNAGEDVFVALSEQKLPEQHQLLSCKVDVPENYVRRGVSQASQLEAG
jgi:hypothetical protein